MIDIEKLRALAMAATPGEWIYDDGVSTTTVHSDNGAAVIEGQYCESVAIAEDLEFIAAANPAAILALTDRLEAMKAKCALLSASLAQAEAETAAAEKDAARYRWMRIHFLDDDPWPNGIDDDLTDDELDAAIDAEIGSGKVDVVCGTGESPIWPDTDSETIAKQVAAFNALLRGQQIEGGGNNERPTENRATA